MALHALVSGALSSSYKATSQELTQQLRERAVDAGWTRGAADTIRVRHSNGSFVASHGPAAADFEYGTESKPPMSVVRTFNMKQHQQADGALMSRLEHALKGVL